MSSVTVVPTRTTVYGPARKEITIDRTTRVDALITAGVFKVVGPEPAAPAAKATPSRPKPNRRPATAEPTNEEAPAADPLPALPEPPTTGTDSHG